MKKKRPATERETAAVRENSRVQNVTAAYAPFSPGELPQIWDGMAERMRQTAERILGRIRRLKMGDLMSVDKALAAMAQMDDRPRVCRVCGCTDERACKDFCFWIETDLCSRCLGKKGGKRKDKK